MKLKRYDIVIKHNVICCFIGTRKNGIEIFETIYSISNNAPFLGAAMNDDEFIDYKPVKHRKYWGYKGFTYKLLKRRNGIKPRYANIVKKYKNYEI